MSIAPERAPKLRRRVMVSASKICPKCQIFCLENIPVFSSRRDGGAAAYAKATGGRLPETYVFCRNGCHMTVEDWAWLDWGDSRFQRVHVPRIGRVLLGEKVE